MSNLEQYTSRCTFPYMQGIYLVANAISDSIMMVDGPNCMFFKTEHIFGAHDWTSTLLDVEGRHRVLHTNLHVNTVITGHDKIVLSQLIDLAKRSEPGVVLVGALPMASITGIQYDVIVEEAEVSSDVPYVLLPARSLSKDWLDGYADTLASIAAAIELPEVDRDPRKVAVVGYLMDRGEEDHRGNVREIRRLLGELGVECVSIWLEGGKYSDLTRVAEAGTIISLPHARSAAKRLARRTGADLVEAPLPFGIEATTQFLQVVGTAVGEEEKARALAERELASLAPRWQWVVLKRFLHRRLAFMGDPYYMQGLCDMANMVGMSVTRLIAYAKEKNGFADSNTVSVPIAWEPRTGLEPYKSLLGEEPLDLLIGHHWALELVRRSGSQLPPKLMEFGFPSRSVHFTFDAPFLGYRGAASFVDRISNTVGDRGVFI